MSSTSSKGRVLVTGAARRVGRATACHLAGRGLDLVLGYHRSRSDCEQTATLCREAGSGDVEVVELPLESDDRVRELGARLVGEGLDGVVHNASRYVRTPLADLDTEEVLMHFRVNALAPLVLTSILAPALRTSRLARGGSVVCMGDIHAMGRPRRDYAGYLASKGALDRIVESLALELGPDVRVNGVAPGVVAWADDDLTVEEQARYVSRIPLDREGTLQEAAETVGWLLLDASYVTGSVVRLDGGRHLG
jgi:pteridine reductase